jgi:apolipoprotein N-acyltransferase
VALTPLLYAIDRGSAKDAGRAGLLAGVLFFGIGFGFVPFAEVAEGPALAVAWAAGVVVLSASLAGVAFLLAVSRVRHRAAPLLLAPAAWLTLEYARSQDLIGIPWLHLGYALADHPGLVAPAALAGVYGVSAWVVAVNAGLVASRWLRPALSAPLLVGLSLPLLVAPLVELGSAPASSREFLRVAAVQPDVSESQRHAPAAFHPNLRGLLELSETTASAQPDLLVWPESAFERIAGRDGDAFLAAVTNALDLPLLTGIWRGAGPGRLRNGALLVERDGEQTWAAEKAHPIVVYERAPTTFVSRALARLGLWSGRFEPGTHPGPVTLGHGDSSTPIGVLVCIDASYPAIARELRRRGARVLVQISNEAGTGAWSAALHARIARFRAAELRVPMLRVSNTGPTLWLDARGRTLRALASGPQAGSHAFSLAGAAPPSVAVGDAPVVLAAWVLGISGAGALAPVRHRSRHTKETLS